MPATQNQKTGPGAIIFFALAFTLPALDQHVADPRASVVDVRSRQATLRATTDPLLRAAINGLSSCVATPFVAAPIGRMNIPHHYLSGSSGPINPAEAPVTHIYEMFERRITAGMNQPKKRASAATLPSWRLSNTATLRSHGQDDMPDCLIEVHLHSPFPKFWLPHSLAQACFQQDL
jgi:hypothetical protein